MPRSTRAALSSAGRGKGRLLRVRLLIPSGNKWGTRGEEGGLVVGLYHRLNQICCIVVRRRDEGIVRSFSCDREKRREKKEERERERV